MNGESGKETAMTLNYFVHAVGIPSSLHSDCHKNFREGEFRKRARYFHIPQTFTEPESPWQNRAEFAGGEIKSFARRLMMKTNTPVRLWCYCFEYTADILCLCVSQHYNLKGRTPYELVAGYTPNISEYVSFSWYQWCYYWDTTTKQKGICRWLGPLNSVGQSISYNLLTYNNKISVIVRSTVIPIPKHHYEKNEVKIEMKKFTGKIENAIGSFWQAKFFEVNSPDTIYWTVFGDNYTPDEPSPLWYDNHNNRNDDPSIDRSKDIPMKVMEEPYYAELDEYINTQVAIPGVNGEPPVLATVKKRKLDKDGNPIGKYNSNPILNTAVYELEFVVEGLENILPTPFVSHYGTKWMMMVIWYPSLMTSSAIVLTIRRYQNLEDTTIIMQQNKR